MDMLAGGTEFIRAGEKLLELLAEEVLRSLPARFERGGSARPLRHAAFALFSNPLGAARSSAT